MVLKEVPLIRLPRVFHVGTLDPADKGRMHSLEGNGLSISLHPEEWCRIAKLGGQPTWEMTRPGGGRFLAFHDLAQEHLAGLTSWAIESGWLETKPQWRLSWHDAESDDERHSVYESDVQAREELQFMLDEGDSSAAVAEFIGSSATAQLVARVGFDPGPLNALDIAATMWAEDVAKLDGVWWEETLGVAALSAPRGVINLSNLGSWERKLREQPRTRPRSRP